MVPGRQFGKHPLFVHSGALPSHIHKQGTFSETFCLKQLHFFASLESDLGLLVLKPFPPNTILAEITGHDRKQNYWRCQRPRVTIVSEIIKKFRGSNNMAIQNLAIHIFI